MARVKSSKPDPVDFDSLEAAANLIIDSFPNEQMRAILRETARAQFIPLWMLVTGLIQRSYDTGEHTAPVLDPLWLNANPVTLGNFGEVVCKTCGETFKPRWPGEEYCGVNCGVAGYRSRIAADRAANPPRPESLPVGSEAPGTMCSTIGLSKPDGETSAVGEEIGKLGGIPDRADPIAEIERDAQISIGS